MKYLYLIVAVLAVGCVCLNQYISNQEITNLQNECDIYFCINNQMLDEFNNQIDENDSLIYELNDYKNAYNNYQIAYANIYNKYRNVILYYECYDINNDIQVR